jgi:hypothetical protein
MFGEPLYQVDDAFWLFAHSTEFKAVLVILKWVRLVELPLTRARLRLAGCRQQLH